MLGVKEKEKAKQLFQKMDTNMDGKISQQEFMEVCKNENVIF